MYFSRVLLLVSQYRRELEVVGIQEDHVDSCS